MNKNLLRFGGALNLLFAVFNLGMMGPIADTLASLSPDVRATVSTLNLQAAVVLLIFGYLAVFRWRDLLTTRLGNIVAIAIALFWLARAIEQVAFYGLAALGVPFIVLCIIIGLLHFIPALREWKNAGSGIRTEEPVSHAEKQVTGIPWTSYAIIAWCVVFGVLHLYWALGGMVGFVEFSMPSNRIAAATRDPLYVGITWSVVIACVVASIVAVAPFQAWTRRLPRWILITPLWIACAMFLLRGIGNPVQSALIVAGGMPFDPLPAGEEQAWLQWLLIDATVYSPWFVLGGLAFGATARFAARQGKMITANKTVSAGQAG